MAVEIFTDGSYYPRSQQGGWAFCIYDQGYWFANSGCEYHTTNDRMELLAVIQALRCLRYPVAATVYCDNQYVVHTINQWLYYWSRNNWHTKGGKLAANLDLLSQLWPLINYHRVTAVWVKGHSRTQDRLHGMNNWMDQKAKAAHQ